MKSLALSWRHLSIGLSGALLSLAFLPLDLWWDSPLSKTFLSFFPCVALVPLFYGWSKEDNPRAAFLLGFVFGLGLFTAGAYWVFISMTTFGGMPSVVAVFFLALLIAYLSLYPACVGYLGARGFHATTRLVALPALWGIFELMRGTLFSGFPWLSLGYTQTAEMPLTGTTPIGGVYLTGIVIAAITASLIVVFKASRLPTKIMAAGMVVMMTLGNVLLARMDWTTPMESSLSVSLVQGNIAQDIKFLPSVKDETYTLYGDLAQKSQGQLILLPESAFPDFLDAVPEETMDRFARMVAEKNATILLGVFTYEKNPKTSRDEYYNSMISLGSGAAELYRKRHLVLFGEKIPFESVIAPIMNALISIPLAGQNAGEDDQPPFTVGNQKIAVSICFEDAFGSEQRDRVLQSTLLANFTNDAWFGHSIAAWQHHRIATLRALESARPMLRVTNTGVTSIINHKGQTLARLPWFTRDVLESDVIGRIGFTPYLKWGDALPFAFALLVLLWAGCGQMRWGKPRTENSTHETRST
ncbi:MAG: apolipoprotein N-acyltransferase [Burkholderiales bacterium]|jgi:apolipoprotein N-acyltransferase|nr:apolipoprotein N-acyltransferase [Burkholderiales bacterium]